MNDLLFESMGLDETLFRHEIPSPIRPGLSAYQSAILDMVEFGEGNIVVKATAGSGKTFTLRHVSEILPAYANSVYIVFGKRNADEAKGKFAIPASTFNSFGNRPVQIYIRSATKCGYLKVDKNAAHGIIDELYGSAIDDIRSAAFALVEKAKGENLDHTSDPSLFLSLLDRFDIDWESPDFTHTDVIDAARAVLRESVDVRSIARRGVIDFNDQLWLVERFNLKLDRQDFVLVDEAQDTNPVQRAILRRIMRPSSRLIAVGDDCQAIYGFRGATNDALALITQEFSAREMPLSISYRCARAIVELASKYGIIEPSPTAKDGAVHTPSSYKIHDLDKMQLILCRNTAPLVSLAYRMIAQRMRVQIRGRDIGTGLKSLITKLSGKRGTLSDLPDKLDAWVQRETAIALKSRNETKAQSVQDKAESIVALIDSLTDTERSRGINGLLSAIDALFSDTDDASKVTLSTIHKAKGLEADHVGILDWHLCPSKYAKRPDQQQQERNLQFVAITRAMNTLTFVNTDTLTD